MKIQRETQRPGLHKVMLVNGVLRGTKGSKLAKRGPKLEHISLPWPATEDLVAIKPEDAAPHDLVFVPMRGERMSVNRDWNRIRDAAALPADLTLHGLRHSVSTAAVVAGLSLPEVQRLLRHRNVSVTTRYIHLAERLARLQDRATAHLDPVRPAISSLCRGGARGGRAPEPRIENGRRVHLIERSAR